MRILPMVFTILSFSLLFSCKSDPLVSREALTLIPESAYSVSEIRVPQLLKKANFSKFQQSEVFQKMVEDTRKESVFFAAILEEPSKSGIDLEQSIYSFSTVSEKNISKGSTVLVASIADAKQFLETMSNVNNGSTPTTQNGISFYSNRNGIAAWTENFAMFGLSQDRSDILALAEKVLMKKHDDNMSQNRSLINALEEDHDINIWSTMNPFAEIGDAKMAAALMNLDPDVLKDNYIYSYVDFNDGEITGRSKFDFQKKLTNDLDLFFKDEVKTDFHKYLPQEDLSMAFTTAFDLKGLNQLLDERPSTKKFVERSFTPFGLEIKDLANIFPGDLALALYNMGDGDTDAYGVFMLEIGDQDGLQQLLDVALEYDLIQKKADSQYVIDDELNDSFFKQLNRNTKYKSPELHIKNGKLMVTANASILDNFSSGSSLFKTGLKGEMKGLLQDHIFGGIINIDEIKVKNLDMELPFGAMNFTADRKQADFNVGFTDGSKNSLEQILDFVNEIYLREKDNPNSNISF